jgi:hypothetical protein
MTPKINLAPYSSVDPKGVFTKKSAGRKRKNIPAMIKTPTGINFSTCTFMFSTKTLMEIYIL